MVADATSIFLKKGDGDSHRLGPHTVVTTGTVAEASGGEKDANTAGKYYKGLAVITIVTGGPMFDASVAG